MASLLANPSTRINLAKDSIEDFQLFDSPHTDAGIGVVTVVNAADLHIACGHRGLEVIGIPADIRVNKIGL